MDTQLVVILAVTAYLAVAGWVHFDTTPAIYDDSQLRRTAKLLIVLPIIVILFVAFILMVIVAEYWEYLRNDAFHKQRPRTT